ncbi:hypothetical protein P0082_08035 [Candidatus Haliotispira prima]|uniref:Uncharacterized protein n=1 Tax=Candidatus Haliotispira prima TaxID=3034016 RepID=A0ABY8MEN1_9SPIO|nr:hypothetical protein P0082_08035 [Candidatus Haliotispira prima]
MVHSAAPIIAVGVGPYGNFKMGNKTDVVPFVLVFPLFSFPLAAFGNGRSFCSFVVKYGTIDRRGQWTNELRQFWNGFVSIEFGVAGLDL